MSLLLLFVWLATAGNTSVSPLTGAPVSQLAAVDQLASPPPPVQVRVAPKASIAVSDVRATTRAKARYTLIPTSRPEERSMDPPCGAVARRAAECARAGAGAIGLASPPHRLNGRRETSPRIRRVPRPAVPA